MSKPEFFAIRPSYALQEHREGVLKIVAEHGGMNPRVFGSVARGEDDVGSDLDILIDCADGIPLFDLCSLCHELESLLHVPVDVLTEDSLRQNVKEQALQDAQPI